MSHALSIHCPHCFKHTSLRKAKTQSQQLDCQWVKNVHANDYWWIGICNACENPVLVQSQGVTIYPSALPSATDNRIPEEIKDDLIEAKMCFSVNAFRGCAVLARRAIQSTCIHKGAKQKDLVKQIDELLTQGVITTDLKDWAHLIRWIGNDAAHPNKDIVTLEDATDILELCEQFLHTIYVAPAIAKERRELRNNNNPVA
jgi:hypothetical protein